METMEKDGKKYKLIDIGRGQTMWKEVKPNKFITFIVQIATYMHAICAYVKSLLGKPLKK